MTKLDFGLTMLIAGAGGTLVSLYVLSLMVRLLKKILPLASNIARAGKAEG